MSLENILHGYHWGFFVPLCLIGVLCGGYLIGSKPKNEGALAVFILGVETLQIILLLWGTWVFLTGG